MSKNPLEWLESVLPGRLDHPALHYIYSSTLNDKPFALATAEAEKRMQMNGYFEDLNQRVNAATELRAAELESLAVAIDGDLMSEILKHYKPSLAPSTMNATELNLMPDGLYVAAYNPLIARPPAASAQSPTPRAAA